MKRSCSYEECQHRRIHWSRPDVERGVQFVDVPDEYPINWPVYCSMTCGMLDGWLTAKYETPEEEQARQAEWLKLRRT